MPEFQHMGCSTNKVVETHDTKVGGRRTCGPSSLEQS